MILMGQVGILSKKLSFCQWCPFKKLQQHDMDLSQTPPHSGSQDSLPTSYPTMPLLDEKPSWDADKAEVEDELQDQPLTPNERNLPWILRN